MDHSLDTSLHRRQSRCKRKCHLRQSDVSHALRPNSLRHNTGGHRLRARRIAGDYRLRLESNTGIHSLDWSVQGHVQNRMVRSFCYSHTCPNSVRRNAADNRLLLRHISPLRAFFHRPASIETPNEAHPRRRKETLVEAVFQRYLETNIHNTLNLGGGRGLMDLKS